MWGWGRPKRDLPTINYNESSSEEEDNFGLPDNAFHSPRVPVHTRAGSPQLLAHPTLNDNVDEVLEEVNYHLGDIVQVEEEIEELTDLLEDTNTKVGSSTGVNTSIAESEIVDEVVGQIKVAPDSENTDGNMPETEAQRAAREQAEREAERARIANLNFDEADGNDGDKAADIARSIKLEFEQNDIKFWFAQIEDEMTMASVNSQWLKKTVLQSSSSWKLTSRFTI